MRSMHMAHNETFPILLKPFFFNNENNQTTREFILSLLRPTLICKKWRLNYNSFYRMSKKKFITQLPKHPKITCMTPCVVHSSCIFSWTKFYRYFVFHTNGSRNHLSHIRYNQASIVIKIHHQLTPVNVYLYFSTFVAQLT